MHIPSYSSIPNLGHKSLAQLFDEPVVVQEKVDGSQISFRRAFPNEIEDGQAPLSIRSKQADLHVEVPDKMFQKGVEQIGNRYTMLTPGWIYRGEYLARPKHNVLAYDRVPIGNIVLFDIDTLDQAYLTPQELADEALRIGFESVPVLHAGAVENLDAFREFLDRTSLLGGQKVEGVVVKNYSRFTIDNKTLMGKFVSEAFREVRGAEWKAGNPGRKDILQFIVHRYRTPARWAKAVQHLREAGQIEDAPRDIGLLFREVPTDIERECEPEIRDALWAHFWPEIRRGITAGLAEWYKEELLRRQFVQDEQS